MKTLSVKQPWGSLLFYGKDVENRSWQTNYRGDLLIHVSSKPDTNLYRCSQNGLFTNEQNKFIFGDGILVKADIDLLLTNLPVSSIIGKVTLVDCIKNSTSIWAEKDCWHWVLENPILFEQPIENVKGKLNLWDYDY
jgi:hypothetical protein